jgi:formate dehydrogenase (NADP+) beta subunit
LPLAEAGCRFCGACAEVCPTGAIMDKEELTKGKNRKKALLPCQYTCPAEIDVPGYIRFIREKQFDFALALIREKVTFPLVLSYVCDHPCETACRRGVVNQPVSIRELKRFAAVQGKKGMPEIRTSSKPSTNKKAAVVGSGPAGLTAAYYLSQQGHAVTVFESLPRAGGMLRYGIPRYRLPEEVLDEEIKYITNAGVEIRTHHRIQSIESLFELGYQSVLVAVGTHQGRKLPIPGADAPGVLTSVDFLKAVNLGNPPVMGEKVVILGGGNVAFDCARTAVRLGARQVRAVCLEPPEHMLASDEEIQLAKEEGVLITPSRTFTRILSDQGKISGVECLEVASFSFDADKNLQVETRQNSEHIIEADIVIFAVGQRPEIPAEFGMATSAGHLIELDPFTLATSREGVFAAGDAVTGTSSVINAIANGRKAAAALDSFLGGDGDIERKLVPASPVRAYLGPGAGFAALPRRATTRLPLPERLKSFAPVLQDMDAETAACESERCLQCDLRLKITRVKFWGDY